MNRNPLRANWELVRLTESALRHGTEGLDSLPDMIRVLLEKDAWREFELPSGEMVSYTRFADFIAAGPPRGLGTTPDLLRNLAGNDNRFRNLLDAALQNQVGHPTINDNVQDKAPAGNSTDRALRRLRKDRPDLLTRVEAGELSPHGAMVQAGFRPRTVSVPVVSPETIARSLKRHLDENDLWRLIELLKDGL